MFCINCKKNTDTKKNDSMIVCGKIKAQLVKINELLSEKNDSGILVGVQKVNKGY